jgi:hypothetical protein
MHNILAYSENWALLKGTIIHTRKSFTLLKQIKAWREVSILIVSMNFCSQHTALPWACEMVCQEQWGIKHEIRTTDLVNKDKWQEILNLRQNQNTEAETRDWARHKRLPSQSLPFTKMNSKKLYKLKNPEFWLSYFCVKEWRTFPDQNVWTIKNKWIFEDRFVETQRSL